MIITKPCPGFDVKDVQFDYAVKEWHEDKKELLIKIMIRERYELLRAMHNTIVFMNHEGAYERWICYVPDEADENELLQICLDSNKKEFNEYVNIFKSITKQYARYGFISGHFGLFETYGEDDDDYDDEE